MRKKHVILIILFFLILTIPSSVGLLSDWLWFKQINFDNIFTAILGAKIISGLVIGLISFGLVFLNFRIASGFTKNDPLIINQNPKINSVYIERNFNRFLALLSLLIGFFVGLMGSSGWEIFLKFFNATSFESVDPIFSRDISFYIFTLPFLKIVLGFLSAILFVSLIGVVVIYFLKGIFSFPFRDLLSVQNIIGRKIVKFQIAKIPKTHILLIISSLFLIAASKTYFITIPNILYSTTGSFTGASYTDIQATLPVLKILSLILLLIAVLSFVNIFRKKYALLAGSIALYLIVAFLGGWLYPVILQKFIVEPNELAKETPYISHNIEATQKAFKLDKVEEYNLTGETALTIQDIENNQNTIKNVRLWDREQLLDTFGQIQEIRTYYDFVSIDNDRYQINGDYRQVLLSARELNSENLPHRTFVNEHLTFTHGFGVTLCPVNEVTEEGLPLLFIKDLPPTSTVSSLIINRPGIYYGELTDNYVVVNTNAKEFDYPLGEENVFTDYQSDGGVILDSFWKKALMAIRFADVKLLLSEDINSQSRIMYYRNIQERVNKVLPFLKLDNDPYLVISPEGSLKWIYDAYTFSNLYPYSQKINMPESVNYIRNSVKIVVDAYDGKMQFYISEPDDPIIKTYAKIFKDTFLSLEEMPEGLRDHLRYPEDIFVSQIYLYAIYHMEEPQIFYNKEDRWQIPRISEGLRDPMVRHIIMKLPEEDEEEFILMIPFTPQGKDNLSAWMVARSDGENYGKLAVYRFPKQKLVYGPSQIINRINQNPEISQQISLWDQRGSEVNQGPLLVIPIEESLMYVRPLYLRAEGGKIPELKRVILAYENNIVMEKTLQECLDKIFIGTKSESEAGGEGVSLNIQKELVSEAEAYYQQAIQAQQRGDWAAYGDKIEKLGDILKNLLNKF